VSDEPCTLFSINLPYSQPFLCQFSPPPPSHLSFSLYKVWYLYRGFALPSARTQNTWQVLALCPLNTNLLHLIYMYIYISVSENNLCSPSPSSPSPSHYRLWCRFDIFPIRSGKPVVTRPRPTVQLAVCLALYLGSTHVIWAS